MSRFFVVLFLVFLLGVQSFLCWAKSAPHPAAQPRTGGQEITCSGFAQLNSYERGQFLEVSLGQRTEVLAQFLAAQGCGQTMLDGLRNLGATVRYADMRSGYALVSILRDRLLDTLDIAGVTYAYARDDDYSYYRDPAAKIPQSERRAEPVPPIVIPYSRVATTLPKDGFYFATDEIGLTALWKKHPEADGRGVRVAVSDAGFDLLHPALRKARNAAGQMVPKVVGLSTETQPDDDSGWVRFGGPINVVSDTFEAGGRVWTSPGDGTYRFGIFKKDMVLGPDGDPHSRKLSLSVGVLWDEHSKRVWVDTDGDGSFKNQRPLGDYDVTQAIDWFGRQKGAEDNRIPFGVKIDPAHNAVYIRIGRDHGAFVAGALAGNKLSGGLFDGAAPSAQLVDSNLFGPSLPSVVSMFARSDVDVINRSGGIGRADNGYRPDGIEDFERHVLERAIAVYKKPFVGSSAAAGSLMVGDYASSEMLRRNRQLAPPYRDYSSAEVWFTKDGVVNVVSAPSVNLDTQSRYDPIDPSSGAPDGYMIGSNPSPTIPVVSGILADLISEARREHVRYSAARLNNAIFTGTRLLEGSPASLQGHGLINAVRSWDQLAKMAKADDPKNRELTSFTSSRVEAGHLVEVNGYHADLPIAGVKSEGEIWITRHGGYAVGRKYTFALRGNDGSYSLLDHQAILVRDRATRVRFDTNGASGFHVVFLELRDSKANVVMADVPLSVRLPDAPERIAPGVDRYESTIEPLRGEARYIRVGEQAQAIRYVMRIPYTGPSWSSGVTLGFFSNGGNVEKPHGEPVDAAHHVGPMEDLESLVANARWGTQTIFWGNRASSEYATPHDGPAPDVPIHAALEVTNYAIAINNGPNDTLTVTNKLAEIQGKVELYDGTLQAEPMSGTGLHGSGDLDRTLPASLVQWRVRVTSNSSSSEPADVYLMNCSGRSGCVVAAQQKISASGKTLVVDKPQAGVWRIVVRSRGQVSAPQNYQIDEAMLVSSPTQPEANDAKHTSGATWTVSLQRKQNSIQYAAFRIAGTPSDAREKDGLLIAMTPLTSDAP